MAKSDLYKISGHWDHYKEGMFILGDEEKDERGLRPAADDLPLPVSGLSQPPPLLPATCPCGWERPPPCFRNEDSRRDARPDPGAAVHHFGGTPHPAVPSSWRSEFKGCLELAIYHAEDARPLTEDVTYRFSQWDPNNDREKYIGTPEQWDEAQGAMQKILDHLGVNYYEIGIGEAAFYGPKLDIQIKNVHGKEDTLITIQIDQMLAELFGMEYVDVDGKMRRPCIIHRTSMGCYERTLALLLEKYAGTMPMWLAPEQIRVLPISEKHPYLLGCQPHRHGAGILLQQQGEGGS